MSELDITKIPGVMRRRQWKNGAQLMEKWFSSKSNSIPSAGAASTNIIKMDWVLSYPRAKIVYDLLIQEKTWINKAAKNEIIHMLKRKSLLGNKRMTFGTPKLGLPQVDKDSIQYRKVGGTLDMAFGDMDDLRAALANFLFKMFIIGEVEPILDAKKKLTGNYKVTIDEVGVYVKDSYDFNDLPGDDQDLGNWDFDDDSVGRTVFNGGESVMNSDFRKWRASNSNGGDFLVYSDIRYIKQNPSDVFSFKK